MRPEKQVFEEEYRNRIAQASFLILTDYSGLDAAAMNRLRRELEKSEAGCLVVKNRLLLRVLGDLYPQAGFGPLKGQTAVTWTAQDPAGLSRTLSKFQADDGLPRVISAVWDGRRIGEADVKRLASLPERPQLLSQVIAGFQAPISGLARGLGQVPASLLYALKAIEKRKSSS